MTPLLIHVWQPAPGLHNVGDYIGIFTVAALGYQPVLLAAADAETIAGFDRIVVPGASAFNSHSPVGRHPLPKSWWGCGFGTDVSFSLSGRPADEVPAVRGPLTRAALRLPESVPMGDIALLLPRFLPLEKTGATGNLYAAHIHCQGHVTPEFLDRMDTQTEWDTTCTADTFISRIQQIRDADFVLTSSLHAAIIAQAYGIPWAFAWPPGVQPEYPQKYHDWCHYLGVPFTLVSTITEGRQWWAAHVAPLPAPDLDPLLAAFPHPATHP